jgi:hypothetical protein
MRSGVCEAGACAFTLAAGTNWNSYPCRTERSYADVEFGPGVLASMKKRSRLSLVTEPSFSEYTPEALRNEIQIRHNGADS